MDPASIAVVSGLIIGLIYGSIGLVSGFCMMSSLRGWWAEGDGRLVRTYALAMGMAVAASQLLEARGTVDLAKSIYLQPAFSVPVLFIGGVLFGYGMVLSNGCGSRALVLLGRGNLRSLVVVIVLGIFAEMTMKGLIAPARIAAVRASQATVKATSLPAVLSGLGLDEALARMVAASVISAARFQSDPPYLADLHRANRGCPAICDVVDGIDAQLCYYDGCRRVCRQPDHRARNRPLSPGRLPVAAAHVALGRRRRTDGHRRRDGSRLLGRPGADRAFDAGAGLIRGCSRHPAWHGDRPSRRVAGATVGGSLISFPARSLRKAGNSSPGIELLTKRAEQGVWV